MLSCELVKAVRRGYGEIEDLLAVKCKGNAVWEEYACLQREWRDLEVASLCLPLRPFLASLLSLSVHVK